MVCGTPLEIALGLVDLPLSLHLFQSLSRPTSRWLIYPCLKETCVCKTPVLVLNRRLCDFSHYCCRRCCEGLHKNNEAYRLRWRYKEYVIWRDYHGSNSGILRLIVWDLVQVLYYSPAKSVKSWVTWLVLEKVTCGRLCERVRQDHWPVVSGGFHGFTGVSYYTDYSLTTRCFRDMIPR